MGGPEPLTPNYIATGGRPLYHLLFTIYAFPVSRPYLPSTNRDVRVAGCAAAAGTVALYFLTNPTGW